jgi:DNA-binding MarR family transcriptional regulator
MLGFRFAWGARNSLVATHKKTALVNDPITAVGDSLLLRSRLLSKVITGIYDQQLRPFGVSAAQFALLAAIGAAAPITRSGIARLQHLDKSTLTRNLRTIFSHGWAEEVRESANGRTKPIALTPSGKELLLSAHPAWLAAQAQCMTLLGDDGAVAVMGSADRILNMMANLIG